MNSNGDIFTILHFNDVYEVESVEREEVCGGAARFSTAVKHLRHLDPMILFSGDCFSPSLLSNFTHGKHIVDVLNALKVECAVIGNHDFDFGVDQLEELMESCQFPWLLSNVYDKFTNAPLADAKLTHIVEKNGRKFGILGLVEDEWFETLATLSIDDVIILDFVEEGRKLAKELKSQGCDFIIALAHMRWPNNEKLAENVDEIDLILGGHDHFYRSEIINGKFVVVSGCEFRQLSQITLNFSGARSDVEVKRIDVTLNVKPDEEMTSILAKHSSSMDMQLDEELGRLNTALDGRTTFIRSQETSLGNFVADIVLSAMNVDVVIINSGTFRSDRIHEAGSFKHRDLRQIFPYLDPMLVLELTGEQLLAVLENSVCQLPKLEGRFLQVAGIRYAFDLAEPPNQRVDATSVYVGDKLLKSDSKYRVCAKHYIAQGNDGYTMLTTGRIIIDVDVAPILPTLVQNFFSSIEIAQGHRKSKTLHRQSIVSFNQAVEAVRRHHSIDIPDVGKEVSKSRWSDVFRRLKKGGIEKEELDDFHVLAPKVDGRIKQMNSNKL